MRAQIGGRLKLIFLNQILRFKIEEVGCNCSAT
jgi:hypothetical protein